MPAVEVEGDDSSSDASLNPPEGVATECEGGDGLFHECGGGTPGVGRRDPGGRVDLGRAAPGVEGELTGGSLEDLDGPVHGVKGQGKVIGDVVGPRVGDDGAHGLPGGRGCGLADDEAETFGGSG